MAITHWETQRGQDTNGPCRSSGSSQSLGEISQVTVRHATVVEAQTRERQALRRPRETDRTPRRRPSQLAAGRARWLGLTPESPLPRPQGRGRVPSCAGERAWRGQAAGDGNRPRVGVTAQQDARAPRALTRPSTAGQLAQEATTESMAAQGRGTLFRPKCVPIVSPQG